MNMLQRVQVFGGLLIEFLVFWWLLGLRSAFLLVYISGVTWAIADLGMRLERAILLLGEHTRAIFTVAKQIETK